MDYNAAFQIWSLSATQSEGTSDEKGGKFQFQGVSAIGLCFFYGFLESRQRQTMSLILIIKSFIRQIQSRTEYNNIRPYFSGQSLWPWPYLSRDIVYRASVYKQNTDRNVSLIAFCFRMLPLDISSVRISEGRARLQLESTALKKFQRPNDKNLTSVRPILPQPSRRPSVMT